MLKPVSRSGFGFEALYHEMSQKYGASLVFLRTGVEDGLLDEVLSIVLRHAKQSADDRVARREAATLVSLAVPLLLYPSNAGSLIDVIAQFMQVDQARALAEQLRDTVAKAGEIAQDSTLLVEEWARLAERSRNKCLAAARGANVHGVGAEDVIKGLADLLPEVEAILDSEFARPPDKSLYVWAGQVRATVSSPEIVLPVVGVFSSGKTTLINHLLGPSPEGHALLRTSQNHNTALLARFHRGTPERIRLSWRSSIDLELMWHGDASARPIFAPTEGQIEKLEPLGDGHLVTLRAKSGEVRWVHLNAQHPPLPGIRTGKGVRAGEPLSVGVNADADAPGLLSERPTTLLAVRPWAIASMLRFIDINLLYDVQLDVRWRERPSLATIGRYPFKIRQALLKAGTTEYREAIAAMKEIVDGTDERLTALIPIPVGPNRVPVAVRFQAKVRGEHCKPLEHPLTGEKDWTWFQGPPDQRSGDGSERHRGFAESAESAWLVEQADIFIDSPLFRLVSIVDTPGLDSISEHHDRITEGCIHNGQAFLVMTRLGHSTLAAATERTFHMIVQSLSAQGIPRDQRSERVFVVLNWFRRDVGARTEDQARKSVQQFKERLCSMLGTERPQLYVVELSPSQLRENPEKVLGFPSLAPLKRDLRSYIGVRGIAVRLKFLRDELDRTIARLEGDMRNQVAGLGEGSLEDIKAIERALNRIETTGSLRTDLQSKIDGAIEAVLYPLNILRKELKRDYEDKNDFEQARAVGEQSMTAYNRARNELRTDLPDEIDAAIVAVVRSHIVAVPRIRRNIIEMDYLPVAPADSFVRDVDKIIREWPGRLKRVWDWITKPKDHPTRERLNLINRYVEDAETKSIAKKCENIRDALIGSADVELDRLADDLRKRLADMKADATRTAERRTEINEQLRLLVEFRPSASRTTRVLDRVIANIESLKHSNGSQA